MLPITLDLKYVNAVVVGEGYATDRRIRILKEAGAENVSIFKEPPSPEEYEGATIVFVGGFDNEKSAEIAEQVRKSGALLNIEDKKQYCDFHMPSIVRRGDLLIATSTGSASPRLAVKIREHLENIFPEEWAGYLDKIKKQRNIWLKEKTEYNDLIRKTDDLIDEMKIFGGLK